MQLRAVLGLGMLASAVLAQGQVQFYFSAPGGDTSRLTADDVNTFGWTGEYDVIFKNTSGATIVFNSGCLMIGFAETTGEGPSASITPGSNKITLLNMANAEAPPRYNPNFGTLPSWFSGYFGCLLGGGRGISGPTRPYGLSVTTDVALPTTQSIGAGQEFLLCRVKFADNGLFSAGGSHDLVLYDGGSTGSFTTALFRLPGSSYRPGANWYADSKLTLNAGGSNQPPVLDAVGDYEVREDRLLTFDASASDPDAGQTLTFSLSGAPFGAYINPTTGIFTWRPSAIQTTQTYTFDVVVTDNGSPALSDIETITVTAERETRAATQVWAWGSNAIGAAGLGPDNIDFPSPTPVPEFLGSSKIVRGEYHTFARLSDGSWLATGWNQFGQLGDGTFDDRRTASAIAELSSFIDIGPGYDFSLGLSNSGTLFAFGAGDMGQLGSGVGDALPSPTQVLVIPNDSILRMMTSAYQTAFAITNTGEVYGFGYNQYGGLGTGSFPPPIEQLIPVLITPMSTPVKIESSYYHSVALLANGTVMTWGRNQRGQLGDGTTINKAAPVPASISDVVDIDLGIDSTYALKRDGTVWGWGWHANRLLGDGTTANFRSTPVQAAGLTNVVDIEACTNAVIALKSDGTVWVWGSNVSGILGNGGSPFSYNVPTQLTSLSNIAGIAAFADTAFAWSYEAGANQAPVLDPIGNRTVAEGSALSLDANATDPDAGQTLTYSLIGAPSGMTIDGATGVVSWTPTETQGPGTYPITVVVTDNGSPAQSDSEAITITVDESNQPPVLVNPGPQVATENTPFTLQLSGSDADLPAQPLTYGLVTGPSGLTVSPFGLVLWTPGESDGGNTPSVTVSLSDGTATVQQTFTISVTESNDFAPVVNGVVDRYGVMGTLFWLVLDVTDPDGPSAFAYSLGAGAPTGMTLDANGLLKWVPTGAQVGTHTFDILVSDDGSPVTTTLRSVSMTVMPVGKLQSWGAPNDGLVEGTPAGYYKCVAGGFRWVSAIRESGSMVAWGDWKPSGLPSGQFLKTSSAYGFGVGLRQDQSLAAWGAGLPPTGPYLDVVAQHSFAIGINEQGALVTWHQGLGDDPPGGRFMKVAAGAYHGVGLRSDGTLVSWGYDGNGQVSNTPVGQFRDVAAGAYHSIAIRTDGTLVSWGYNGNGVVANTPAGTFLSVAGGYTFSVGIRSDGTLVAWGYNLGLPPAGSYVAVSATEHHATAIRRNQSPILNNPGAQSASEQTPFSLQLTGSDPDVPADPLTYALVSGPTGLTVSASGLVQWTPGETDGGTAPDVTVSVNDGAETVQATFTITVAETNQNPVLTDPSDLAVNEGSLASVSLSATDPDLPAQSLTYSLVSGPGSVTGNTWSWTPGETDGPGSFTVTVQVSDGTATASQNFLVTVNESNQPPVLVNPGPQTASENSAFTLQMSGSDPDLPAQGLTYAKVGGPSGLTVSPSGLVLWTPGESDGGTAPSVTVSLSDGVATVQQTFTISVTEDNQPPIVNGVVDRYGVMGTLFWLVLDVTDPDGPSTFTYSLGAGAPAGVTLDASGLLKWVPTGAQVGTHTFDIIVSDNGSPAATTTRSVTMTVASAGRLVSWGDNSSGMVSQTPLSGTFVAASSGEYAAFAIRQSGSIAAWGTNHYGTLTGTPSGTFVGVAADAQVCSALRSNGELSLWGYNYDNIVSGAPQGSFLSVATGRSNGVAIRNDGTLTVWSVNNYGLVSQQPTGRFLDCAGGEIHMVAIRSDGSLVSWGANNYGQVAQTPVGTFRKVAAGARGSAAIRTDGSLVVWGETNGFVPPAGAYIDVAMVNRVVVALRSDGTLIAGGVNAFGLISGLPTGTFSILGTGGACLQAIRRNSPPTLTNPGPKNATEHATFTLQLSGTDVETPTGLTYGLVSGPSGLTVSTSGLVKWTPGEVFGGTVQNVSVRVSDGIDTTTETFPITIAEANGAPVCQNDVETVSRGTTKDIDVRANDSDPEGNSFLVTSVSPATPNYGSVSIAPGGTKVRFTAYSSPFYTNRITKFTYIVTDALGATSSAQVQVTIK